MGKGRKKMSGEQREKMNDPSKGRAKIVKTAHLFDDFSAIPPKFLKNDDELEIWNDLYSTLKSLSFLSEADKPTAGLLCAAYADWSFARKMLHKNEEENEQNNAPPSKNSNKFVYETDTAHGKMLRVHPLLKIMESRETEIHKCQKSLSMTTLDRQNMMMKVIEHGGTGRGTPQPVQPENQNKDTNLFDGESPLGWGTA